MHLQDLITTLEFLSIAPFSLPLDEKGRVDEGKERKRLYILEFATCYQPRMHICIFRGAAVARKRYYEIADSLIKWNTLEDGVVETVLGIQD